MKATEEPKILARKINVSESTLYGYLRELRNFGAEIRFNREINSYEYKSDIKFYVGFVPV